MRIKWRANQLQRERALRACSVLCFIQSIFLAFYSFYSFFSLSLSLIFFLLLNFVSLYFIYLYIISFFFFCLLIRLKALDTEAYQVGLWAGEGDHGAVKSPRTYRSRRLLNTRCVDPIARVRARFSTTTTRARGNNIENRTLEIFFYFFNFLFFLRISHYGRKSSLDTGCFSEMCRFSVFFYFIIYFVVRYLPPRDSIRV